MPTIPTIIDIDPDPSSGFEALFMAGLRQVKSIPEEILRQMPNDLRVRYFGGQPSTKLASCSTFTRILLVETDYKLDCQVSLGDEIPPRECLSSLDTALDCGWASGIHSIEVPAGSKDLRFPLWIGNFWLEKSHRPGAAPVADSYLGFLLSRKGDKAWPNCENIKNQNIC